MVDERLSRGLGEELEVSICIVPLCITLLSCSCLSKKTIQKHVGLGGNNNGSGATGNDDLILDKFFVNRCYKSRFISYIVFLQVLRDINIRKNVG